MTLARESWVLIGICMIDLIATLIMLNAKVAFEGNPLMSFYLRYGIGTFVLMKLALVLLPVFVFEWCRLRQPDFVRFALRAVIVTYVGVYLILFLTVNAGMSGDGAPVPIVPVYAQQVPASE